VRGFEESAVPLTVLSVAYPLAPVRADVPGGAEQVLLQLDRALIRAGDRSLVIACEGSGVVGDLISTSKLPPILDDQAKHEAQRRHAGTIARTLRSERVDLVHMHGCDFFEYLPAAGVPVLATLHLPLAWYPAEALQPSRPGTWLHCVSKAQHDSRPARTRFLPPIENGVEVVSGPLPGKDDFALFLGRICPEKGVHLAIDAAKRANVPLIIAGDVFPYEAHRRYFNDEVEPRLDTACRFIGSVGPRQKEVLLATSRCLLVPSLVDETSSLVAREALAAGTPVIAFPRRALVDIIEQGRTGFIVDSIEEMAVAIGAAKFIDGETCRETAKQRFPLSRMIASYFAVYHRLATEHAAMPTADG
jgi:glycosyltransferase involved in cell wall biosynthesis